MSFSFFEAHLKEIAALKKRYPSPQALTLPCLWMAEQQEGYISLDAIDAIAEQTGTPAMEVYRVATFYTMFHLEPPKRRRVQVCKTLSCQLCGADEILKHLETKALEIVHAECLGSCGTAPVMQIEDVNYENLTPEKVDAVLEKLK